MEIQIVVFTMASESYGVNIASVESIIKIQPITPLPHAPLFIEGVINLRGVVLPVMDLRRRFGYPTREVNQDNRIIVINIGEEKYGMIVDEVSEVLTITDTIIEPPPPITSSQESIFVSGIAKCDKRLIILLDLERILDKDPQLSLLTAG